MTTQDELIERLNKLRLETEPVMMFQALCVQSARIARQMIAHGLVTPSDVAGFYSMTMDDALMNAPPGDGKQ